MGPSLVGHGAIDPDATPPEQATYLSPHKVLPYYTTATPASGELFVSAHDLARFAIFDFSEIRAHASTILERKWIAELQQPVLSGLAMPGNTGPICRHRDARQHRSGYIIHCWNPHKAPHVRRHGNKQPYINTTLDMMVYACVCSREDRNSRPSRANRA